jgi:2-phosphosulfolactate phosphatase
MMKPASSRPPLTSIEVLLTPAEFNTLRGRDLSRSTCVVFDVLRATTSMITALANGAEAILPVADIPEALAIRARRPEVLLAGERQGLRIRGDLTGGVEFDLGNSPREFSAEKVRGKIIVMTTTNGTRAFRACAGARTVLAGAFLNLAAVADWVRRQRPEELIVVCSGTFEQTAFEDVLAAGALLHLLEPRRTRPDISDAVQIAQGAWTLAEGNLLEAVKCARNARRLLGNPQLAGDVLFSIQRDTTRLVAALTGGGELRELG